MCFEHKSVCVAFPNPVGEEVIIFNTETGTHYITDYIPRGYRLVHYFSFPWFLALSGLCYLLFGFFPYVIYMNADDIPDLADVIFRNTVLSKIGENVFMKLYGLSLEVRLIPRRVIHYLEEHGDTTLKELVDNNVLYYTRAVGLLVRVLYKTAVENILQR